MLGMYVKKPTLRSSKAIGRPKTKSKELSRMYNKSLYATAAASALAAFAVV